jgi:hypothetical protein
LAVYEKSFCTLGNPETEILGVWEYQFYKAVLLEKPIVALLRKKFSILYET